MADFVVFLAGPRKPYAAAQAALKANGVAWVCGLLPMVLAQTTSQFLVSLLHFGVAKDPLVCIAFPMRVYWKAKDENGRYSYVPPEELNPQGVHEWDDELKQR